MPWAFTHDGKQLAFSDIARDSGENARLSNANPWMVAIEFIRKLHDVRTHVASAKSRTWWQLSILVA